MITPIWLIPPLALAMLVYRIYRFWESKYTNFLHLGLGIVDVYFIVTYVWILNDPVPTREKLEAMAAGVVLLFFLNVLYKIIELFGEPLYRRICKLIRKYWKKSCGGA